MLDIAIMIEGQDGLNWDRWKRLAEAAEHLGFAGLYRSDHFTNPTGPHKDALELWISFAFLASTTSRIEFGPMVSPISFRNPVISAWSAAAVDDLSGGRFRMGLGAGWQEREHKSYGFELLELDERFERFEEGINVVRNLLRSDRPFNFHGRHFQLEDALLLPRPTRRHGPPIVIGGNGQRRTMPLAARYGDEWNAVFVTPERFRQLSDYLDSLIEAENRRPATVRRTLMHRITVGKSTSQVKSKTEGTDVSGLRERGAMIGTPSEIVEGIARFSEAGVQRLMAQLLDLTDIDGLELLSSEVMPQLRS